MRRSQLFGSVVSLFIACPALAQEAPAPTPLEQHPHPFGERGSFALDDLFGVRAYSWSPGLGPAPTIGVSGLLSYSTARADSGTSSSASTTIALAPSADYFVANRWSLGGRVTLASGQSRYDPGTGTIQHSTVYAVGAQPRLGYVLRLGESLALWPRVGFGYNVANARAEVGATTSRAWTLAAELGLVVRLGAHAYVNVGPDVAYVAYTSVDPTAGGLPSGSGSSLAGGARATLGLVF
jgi:hypothetical protein